MASKALMSVDIDLARKLCGAAEWRLVEASEPDALNTLTLAKLRNKIDQARKLRDTWCDMAARLGQPTTDAARFIPQKAELFAEVLRRFEEHLQKVESSAAEVSGGAGRKRASRSAARRRTAAAKPAGPLSTDEFIAQLRKLRFFEGYTDDAAKLAEQRIRTQHAEGLSGPLREYFERFPGFALVFVSIDGEWGYDPCEPLVETVAQNSFGMFNPTGITDERDDEAGTATLSFTANGQQYSRTIAVEDSGGWVPTEFLELVEEAFAEHCGNLHFHETLLCAAPGGSDCSTWTICTNRAYKALEKAKLLPSEAAEI